MNYYDLAFKEQTLFELLEAPSKTEAEKVLKLALRDIIDEIEITKGEFTRKRLNELFALIASEISPAYKQLLEDLQQDAIEASAITYGAYIGAALPKSTIEEIVNQNRLIQGYQFKDLIKATSDNHVRQLKRVIGKGVAKGKPSHVIVKELREKDKKLIKSRLNSAVFTYISESRAITRHKAYNELGINCFEYVATLDGNTTEYCREHDGRKYHKPIKEIQGEINIHFHCRSVFIPCVDTKHKRASQFGEVDGNTTYGEWFKLQDEAFQKKVLGKKKFEAYKKGKYIVGGLSDVKGKELSFKEIKDTLAK